MLGVDPEHGRDPARRRGLAEVEEVGGEADQIPALVAGREIAPRAGAGVDLEAARPLVLPLWVQDDIFLALAPAARQPALKDDVEPAPAPPG